VTGQTKGAVVIMVLPQENWGRTAWRRDSGKRRAGWDRSAGASVCGGSRSPLFPRRPGVEGNRAQAKRDLFSPSSLTVLLLRRGETGLRRTTKAVKGKARKDDFQC